MIAVALKGLAGRKVRALLTAFAVVIGVTMVSGTLVLTDTIQKAFDGIFGASYEQTDAVIAGKEIVKGSQSGAATVPESLLARSARCPRSRRPVARSRRTSPTTAEIFGRDGKPLGSGDAPQFGLGNDASQPQFSPLKLKTGQWPEGPGQVALDADTAAGENFKVGDTVAVSTLGAKRRYEVTGIATFGGRRLARRRHDRDLGPADRPDAAGQGRPLRQHLDRRQGRHVTGRARPRRPAAGPRQPRGQGLRRSRPRRTPRRPTSSSTRSATSCWASARSRCSSARS